MTTLSDYIPSNPPSPGGFDYPAKKIALVNGLATRADPYSGVQDITNLSIVASVASNALTLTLKARDGSALSADTPAAIAFRSVTAANGDYSVLALTAAQSITIPSGATMGASNGVAFRLWVVAFNDGGTFRLGVVNCLSGQNIFPLGGHPLRSSTLLDSASDAAHVIYTGAAVTSKAMRVLGYLEYNAGLAAAGTYNIVPTLVRLATAGVPLPGDVVQSVRTDTGTNASGTTIMPLDNTVPQNTEGDEYMSRAITPESAANLLRVDAKIHLSCANSTYNMLAALFRDSTANALSSSLFYGPAANVNSPVKLDFSMLAGGTAATTFKVRGGCSAAATTQFNPTTSGLGGALNSYISVTEVMA